MAKAVVYLKCSRSAQVIKPKVFLRDIATVHSSDEGIQIKCREITVYQFTKPGETHAVLSVIHLIALIEKQCPELSVVSVGESDVLVEYESGGKPKAWLSFLKVFAVCAICFCGTSYTIMAFHNDIGIHDIFDHVYELVMGYPPQGMNVLEVAYSIGLGVGILVFFNHVGRIRLRKQPTPIEVSMKTYETDMDRAIIEIAERAGISQEG